MSDPHLYDDAAYLLGALDDADRDAFEAHLTTCAACRDRVAELRPTAGLLAGLRAHGEPGDAGEPDAGPVPDTLLPGLLRRAARERSRRRLVTAGLAGLAAACLIALVVVVWPASSPSQPPARALHPVRPTPVVATARLVSRTWGTQIDLACKYERELSPKIVYRLVVVDVDRRRYDAGGWTVGEGTTHFIGGTEVRRDRISRVEITLPDGSPILRLTV
jgi:anti-sigma factor RsiW